MKNIGLQVALYQVAIGVWGTVQGDADGEYDSPYANDTTSDDGSYFSSSTTGSPLSPNDEESNFVSGVLIATGLILGLFVMFILYKKYCENGNGNGNGNGNEMGNGIGNTKSKKSIQSLQATTKSAANKIEIKAKKQFKNAKMKLQSNKYPNRSEYGKVGAPMNANENDNLRNSISKIRNGINNDNNNNKGHHTVPFQSDSETDDEDDDDDDEDEDDDDSDDEDGSDEDESGSQDSNDQSNNSNGDNNQYYIKKVSNV